MKFNYALLLLTFVIPVTAMPPKKNTNPCTKQTQNVPALGGKVTTIECQQKNGCTTTKTIFPGGDSLTIQNCPPAQPPKNQKRK